MRIIPKANTLRKGILYTEASVTAKASGFIPPLSST